MIVCPREGGLRLALKIELASLYRPVMSLFSFTSTTSRTLTFSQTSIQVLNVFCQRADLVVSFFFTAFCLASPALPSPAQSSTKPAAQPTI